MITLTCSGGVAQLVERLICIQEASGPTPLTSTILRSCKMVVCNFLKIFYPDSLKRDFFLAEGIFWCCKDKAVISHKYFFLLFLFIFCMIKQASSLSVLFNCRLDKESQILQSQITDKINKIIIEELSLITPKKRARYEFPVFKPQDHPHVTLFFDRTIQEKFEQSAVLMLQVMQSLGKGRILSGNINLTPEVDLFGFHEEFFVIKVRDESKALTGLRCDILSVLRWLNRYACASGLEDRGYLSLVYDFGAWIKSFFVPTKVKRSIFDVTTWDKYIFSPHVTLGMLPRREIFRIASWMHADSKQVWETIKNRIRAEVFQVVKDAQFERELVFTSLQVTGKNYAVLHDLLYEQVGDNKKMITMSDAV